MATSERTEKLKNKLFWLRFVQWFILIAPVFYFFVSALAANEGSIKKATLVVSVLIGLALIIFNIILKFHMRSPLWLALFGIHTVLDKVQVLLMILFIFSLVDEVFITPQIKKIKQQLITNKEMDKRLS